MQERAKIYSYPTEGDRHTHRHVPNIVPNMSHRNKNTCCGDTADGLTSGRFMPGHVASVQHCIFDAQLWAQTRENRGR